MAISGPKRLVPPRPPADFASIDLSLTVEKSPSRTVYRLAEKRFRSCLHFSRRGEFRFDSPTAAAGVCYLAELIESAFLEVFADAIRAGRLDYLLLQERVIWEVKTPPNLNLLPLAGAVLTKIRATAQSFVSRYTLSQEWGRAFLDHPIALDGVVYTGRQSGLSCLALFGDDAHPRWHQPLAREQPLGRLTEWEGFFPLLDRAGARVANLPKTAPKSQWRV